MGKPLPTQERLRELFDYHPDGYFIRRERSAPSRRPSGS
jgi:hypothetical protein